MFSCIAVYKRVVVTLVALAFAVCLLGTQGAAQVTTQPKDEVFGGYSWLHPNGYANANGPDGTHVPYKVPDKAKGFDFSNTYYLPTLHNVGFVIDGSGHWGGSYLGHASGTQSAIPLVGLQYKYHTSPHQLSPFARFLVGTSRISPEGNPGEWKPAIGGGGGLDLNITNKFAWRIAQVDYIYTTYNPGVSYGLSTTWNSIRLATGVVVNLGTYYNPPLSCTASATPAEVFCADPVKVTTTGTNFPPKHTLFYAWAGNGLKLTPDNAQSATVDTTGMAPGNYSASSTITDPKLKNHDAGIHSIVGSPEPMKPAVCAANFTIKQPLPPVVSCSASPSTIAIGESATVTMTASDPQGWPMTYNWSTTGGTLSGSGTTATVTATNADAGNTITVTGTATTDRPGGNPCHSEQQLHGAWSTCLRCSSAPSSRIGASAPSRRTPRNRGAWTTTARTRWTNFLCGCSRCPVARWTSWATPTRRKSSARRRWASQRSVNVKYYLTTDGPNKADASRIQPRDGGVKGQATHFYYVPEGCLQSGQAEEGTVVDETVVQPQSRNAPAPKKAKKAKPAAAPAQ